MLSYLQYSIYITFSRTAENQFINMPRFRGRYAARTYRRRLARSKQQTFRRRYYKPRRLVTYSANSGGATALRFKKKTFRPRGFIRRAYRESDGETRYRSFSAGSGNVTAPTTLGTAVISNVQAIPDNFMTTAGGLVLGGGITNVDDNWAPKIFVRGGVMSMTFCNRLANLTNVRIKVWLVKARNVLPASVNTAFSATGVASSFDPTTQFTWWQIIQAPFMTTEKILEPGDAWTIEQRIKPFMMPQWQSFQTGYLSNMPWWIFQVEPCQAGVAAAVVDWTRGNNLSFSGDINGPTY